MIQISPKPSVPSIRGGLPFRPSPGIWRGKTLREQNQGMVNRPRGASLQFSKGWKDRPFSAFPDSGLVSATGSCWFAAQQHEA